MTTTTDLGIKFRPLAEREKATAERFVHDVQRHVLTVGHDDGLYRHLKIRQPDDSNYWYEVVTWPGCLAIRGDMGAFTFSRTEDMFGFFRSAPGYVNPGYWAEKAIGASEDGIQAYSSDTFREVVASYVAEWVDPALTNYSEDQIPSLIQAVKDRVLRFADDETDARHALGEFWHEEHQFSNVWEMDFRDYTYRFLWNLHAIVHAVNLYDASKAGAA